MTKLTEIVKAHTTTPTGMSFYSSLELAREDVAILSYISVIKRAWEEMNLSGVLCLDGRPVLYLKEYNRQFTPLERIQAQRSFWNQGVANVLVLADPTTVYLYSGLAKPPKDQADKDSEHALVERLSLADYVQRIQAFHHDLATGNYYETRKKHFDPREAVDSWLLDNIRGLRNALIEGKERLAPKHAHAFIGRVLFLCYLLDRGIYSIGKPDTKQTGTMVLADTLEKYSYKSQINYLYDDIFPELKERFNGNMFDQDLGIEKRLIRPIHLDKLAQFLGGHDVSSGQRTLGFWAYDFKMIPVETISAIYQDFLATEDKENQQKRGAFYTPRFLAEMVVDIAMRNNADALNWSYLDPSCGSGIFLVILFNRISNRWLYSQTGTIHYAKKAKALQGILKHQIRGVDIEVTACRIACFSLYLAYLDFFSPPDIQNHTEKTGQPLPHLLIDGETQCRTGVSIPVIHKADFTDNDTLFGETFDCIIGNPPWEGRGSKQKALKFIQRAPQLLKENGTGCLLLPSKIIQNQTDEFQADWLQRVTLESILQLADYRLLLFQNAICPAIIVRFRNELPKKDQHKIEFAAPKFNRDGLRQGVIAVNPSARSWIPLIDVLSAAQNKTASVLWKRHLWGTPRDQKFIQMLQSMPSLSEHVDILSDLRIQKFNKTRRWVAGEGLKPWQQSKLKLDRQPKKLRWSLKTPFIETTSWNSNLILFPSDTMTLGERLKKKNYRSDVLYSQPPDELFRGPMVLFSRGFDKVAYCDFEVLFQHSLRSIKGPLEDATLLMFLTAYLQSNLARYFLFHTSSSWGSERDQVHLEEVLRVPFPLPGSEFVSSESKKIVETVARSIKQLQQTLQDSLNHINEFKHHAPIDIIDELIIHRWAQTRKRETEKLNNELNPLIYRYFGLTEQEILIVEDTINVFEPSSTPTTWRSANTLTLEHVERTKARTYVNQGLKAYADILTATMNKWAKNEGSSYRVSAEGATDDKTGLSMITINTSRAESPYLKGTTTKHLFAVLKQFHRQATRKHGALLYERDIFFIHRGRIYIIRPNILLNWTRTAAINDATRIYGDIALAQRGDHEE